jgi:hypothetical protein
MSKSICCNADTRIGYYSDSDYSTEMIIIAKVGTYCSKCDKLCNYISRNKYYHCDGNILDPKLVRKIKLDEIDQR